MPIILSTANGKNDKIHNKNDAFNGFGIYLRFIFNGKCLEYCHIFARCAISF